MNSDFSRVMTLLRKERNISQKKVAADLGISQALLSHYEKGKRECGLDFLIKAADYYSVSCDYLLGRSPEPQGKTISFDEIPEEDDISKDRLQAGGVMAAFNRKLIVNSVNLLFSLLQRTKSNTLVKEVSSYIMLAIYKMFRIVFSSNPKNDQNFFKVPNIAASACSNAAMNICEANAAASANGTPLLKGDIVVDEQELIITTQTLADEYPQMYSSMVNLIKNSEAKIQILNNAEK